MVRRTTLAPIQPFFRWPLLLGAVAGAALALGLARVQFQVLSIEHHFWPLCPLLLGLGAVAGGLLLPRLLARRRSGGVTMCLHCHAVKEEGRDPGDPAAWRPSHRYLADSLGGEVSQGLCPLCKLEHYAQPLPSSHFGPASGPPRA